MPRENNPNILLKVRKLPAKQDEPLSLLPQALPPLRSLAKPTLLPALQPQFHSEIPFPEPPLQPIAKTGDWNPADEMKLQELHNQLGNRWSLISHSFPGKSDNCVKNHFFSRLRMSLRHLNKQLPEDSETKPVKIHVVYKIMSTCQERFNPDSQYIQQFIDSSYQLKNKILDFLAKKDNPSKDFDVEKTIQEIHVFNKRFKLRADILKIPKASRIIKPKKQRESSEIQQDEDSVISVEKTPIVDSTDQCLNDVPQIAYKWNSLQAILQESLRLSQVLQLQNERVEIKMVDTSQYLFNEEDSIRDGWPFDLAWREPFF